MAAAISHVESTPQFGIRLDDSRAFWRLKAGTADVFAVDPSQGGRLFLLRVTAGGHLIAEPASGGAQLIARLSGDAVLQREPSATRDEEALSTWTSRIADAAQIARGLTYSTVLTALLRLLREREASHEQRITAKLISAGADVDEALCALSNPQRSHRSDGVCGGNALWAACEAAARVSGATLIRHDPSQAADGIEEIARVSGVPVRRIRLTAGWWRRDSGAMVGYWRGAPVALTPSGSRGYRLWEPVSGKSVSVDARTAAEVAQSAHVFFAPLPTSAISLRILGRFVMYGARADVLRVLAYNGASSLLGLLPPVLMASFADAVLSGSDAGQLAILVSALAAAAFCSVLFNLGAGMCVERAGARAATRLSAAVWDRLLKLPSGFFRQFDPADLSMRVAGLERVRESLTGVLASGAMTALFSAVHLELIARFAHPLLVPAVAVLILVAVASTTGGCLTLRRQAEIADLDARASRSVLEAVQGIGKLRVAGAEARIFASWARDFACARAASLRAGGVSAGVAALNAALPLSGCILVAAMAVADPGLRAKPAWLLAFAASFQKLLSAAVQLSESALTLARSFVLLRRVSPILEAAPEFHPGSADPGVLTGKIELREITFRYNAGGAPVMDRFSLQVEPGEFVAIVGASGCGKSTLLRLLLGFERPHSGAVLFDGRDLASLNVQAVRRQLGVVLQGGRIFAGDIQSNILAASGQTLEAAEEAAQVAGIANDIRAMPMGMYTQLSDGGAELSGGQRQRILIARALVHKPRVLLFDEATSALDNRTQAAVSSSIERLGATRVVIAHRLSTIRHADRILVLDSGRIVESGTYDELLTQRGRFYDLARRQSA